MRKFYTILTIFTFISSIPGVFAQNNCAFVCHNGSVVKAVNENAINGHLTHGDVYLGDCDTYTGSAGDDCSSLSLVEFSFKDNLPLNEPFFVYDIQGRELQKGSVTVDFYSILPKKG